MPPLTRRPARDSIRKLGLLAVLSATTFGGGGCATGGPNHVYVTIEGSPAVHDLGPPAAEIARAVAPEERALGLAYDFNTDHLFLRIAPAQVIRVIERPSGKILREMPLPVELRTERPADLALRSSDRHLFAVHPDGRSVVELTLFGEFVRRLELSGLTGPIGGLAYDQKNRRLVVLAASSPARIGTVAADGSVLDCVTLHAAVNAVSLGYDSEAQHCFVPLEEGNSLGEFDAAGALLKKHPVGESHPITALDAGLRSFVRVF